MNRSISAVIISIPFLISSCKPGIDRKLNPDISGIEIPEVKIHRYDADLFTVPAGDLRNGLEALKERYRFFLGTDLSDPLKLDEMRAYLANPRNIEFQKACREAFTDLTPVEKELTLAFRHFRYYFPALPLPNVYSYISGGDYENPVQVMDSVMIIGLDNYLGQGFKPYVSDGVPLYKVKRMTPENIVPDCMRALLNQVYPGNPSPGNLLGQMVEAGKKIYLLEAMMPSLPGNLLLDYSPEQFDWITHNESGVWAAIIDNRMLYSTDNQVSRSFLADGPFTAEFSRESPPRLGEWIGWQIVKGYMSENSEIMLTQLLKEADAQKILSASGYKPGK
jgi:hypothetical protein